MNTFKTSAKGRIARRSMLAALLPAAGASLALAKGKGDNSGKDKKDDSGCFRLGGSFIGRDDDGTLLNFIQVPLDPAGKTASTQVMVAELSKNGAGLLTALGADALSNHVGEMKMISPDTAQQTAIGYAIATGNPVTVKAIHLVSATARFVDHDTIMYSYASTVYAPSADGLPHGNPLLGPLPPIPAVLKRITVE